MKIKYIFTDDISNWNTQFLSNLSLLSNEDLSFISLKMNEVIRVNRKKSIKHYLCLSLNERRLIQILFFHVKKFCGILHQAENGCLHYSCGKSFVCLIVFRLTQATLSTKVQNLKISWLEQVTCTIKNAA